MAVIIGAVAMVSMIVLLLWWNICRRKKTQGALVSQNEERSLVTPNSNNSQGNLKDPNIF